MNGTADHRLRFRGIPPALDDPQRGLRFGERDGSASIVDTARFSQDQESRGEA